MIKYKFWIFPVPCVIECSFLPFLFSSIFFFFCGPPMLRHLGERGELVFLSKKELWKQMPQASSQRFVVIQSLSRVRLFVTPWTAARQASLPSLSPWVCSSSCPVMPSPSLSLPSPLAFNFPRIRDWPVVKNLWPKCSLSKRNLSVSSNKTPEK